MCPESSMKIQPSFELISGGKVGESQARDGATAKPAAGANPSPGGADRVRLSDLSAQLAALESTLGDQPIDTGRVEAIKAAIRDGTLTVDSSVVADRMLASAIALLGKDAE
jgi:negative regulator of flagellin synthesis FlgM